MLGRQRETSKRLTNSRFVRGKFLCFIILCPILVILCLVIYIQKPLLPQQREMTKKNRDKLAKGSDPTQMIRTQLDNLPMVSSVKIPNVVILDSAKSFKKKVAYAITVTKDGPFVDGALVLGYAAKKVHDASKGYQSNYDADLIAFVAPGVVLAKSILESFGWKVLERPLPVEISEIVNKEYADKMKNSGCCGADEFLKLWAYTLTEYHRVIHLDMDSIVFKNMVSVYL